MSSQVSPARVSAALQACGFPCSIRWGSTPASPNETNLARGSSPSRSAALSLAMSTAAAPSLICDELPAVTVPSGRKAGLSAASASADVSRRGVSSTPNSTPACGFETSTGTISCSNRPVSIASNARRCDSSEKASSSARTNPHSLAITSDEIPCGTISHRSRSLSDRSPPLEPMGTRDIISTPADTTRSSCPDHTAVAALKFVCIEEPHCRSTVVPQTVPAHNRAEILVRVAGALGRRHDEVARLISAEAGKPMKAARVEAQRAMSTYTFAAVEARKLSGEMVPMDAAQAGEGKLAFTLRLPIGVVGAISPFNFPLNLVAHKIAPALAAGCAVVLKPASQTPLSALFLAELEEEAGLPPGWLNVLVGPAPEIGDVLVDDERVKLITFTGSSGVGWKLKERAPKKRVNLELGNATPVIVASDADVSTTAAKVSQNAFALAGQSCISVQRVYVERSAYDEFVKQLLPLVEALNVGDPADEDTDVGPVIDEDARERILAWIKKSSGQVLTGGELVGELFRPTVIANPGRQDEVSCEEVFGPVCTVTAVDSIDEAIELANGTRYGLQAGIFTATLANALRAAQELEFGGVTVNEAPTFRADQMPYGGVKDSGNTREGPHYAVRELTEERLVVVDLPYFGQDRGNLWRQ